MNLIEIIKRIIKIKDKEYSLVNNLEITLIPTRKMFNNNDNIIYMIKRNSIKMNLVI